jgi:hypothetical protein
MLRMVTAGGVLMEQRDKCFIKQKFPANKALRAFGQIGRRQAFARARQVSDIVGK